MIIFLKKLGPSIFTQDVPILFVAILTYICYKKIQDLTVQVKNEIELCKRDETKRFTADLLKRLNESYNLFTTAITVFPLLGMLGTVIALIGLNASLTETGYEIVQNNFFNALTSTAWGIIFAIIFKVMNARIEYKVISQIEAAEKVLAKEENGNNSRLTKEGIGNEE